MAMEAMGWEEGAAAMAAAEAAPDWAAGWAAAVASWVDLEATAAAEGAEAATAALAATAEEMAVGKDSDNRFQTAEVRFQL